MNPKLIKAIVIDQVNGSAKGRGPYRNIKNAPGAIRNYKLNMIKLFPNATHINFYDHNGQYLFRETYPREEKEEKKVKRLKPKYLNALINITGDLSFFDKILFSQWDL